MCLLRGTHCISMHGVFTARYQNNLTLLPSNAQIYGSDIIFGNFVLFIP